MLIDSICFGNKPTPLLLPLSAYLAVPVVYSFEKNTKWIKKLD
ncbi:hypothetical protein LV92_03188 [Arenibacter echinorum]|uniref:Uncharacterized protein n=1 Tax=Arenibacter echinorum TaxID=440515 RepID=A0A327QX79_9FLAO|nr:hypothetical protein LV92_03188 [Arenibacter echinorum]